MNTVLKSKKGKEMTREELLAYLLLENKEQNLSILYKDGKPILVHKYNEQGPLGMITASVVFPMLLSKFVITKSEAYELALWISENFGELPSPEEPETETEPTGYFVTVLDDIREILNIDPKQTKKELLAQLTSIEFLINK